MAKEYIEREAFLKKYDEKLITDERMLEPQHVRWLVADFPAADVKPVVRGEWIEESPDCLDGDSIYVCSICGETWCLEAGTPQDNNMNFCPNCGADMRGGDGE